MSVHFNLFRGQYSVFCTTLEANTVHIHTSLVTNTVQFFYCFKGQYRDISYLFRGQFFTFFLKKKSTECNNTLLEAKTVIFPTSLEANISYLFRSQYFISL